MVWGTFFGDEVPQSARLSAGGGGGVQKPFGQCPNAFCANLNGAPLSVIQCLRISWTHPLVPLYVYFQLLALSELFWTHGTLVILDIEMDLLMRFQNVLVKKAFATALKRTFELSLRCVLHKVALQVVLVTAPVIRKCFRRNI